MSENDRVATVDRATTRRALLVAAAGGAAALAARAALPAPALAADPNDLVLNQDNPTILDTGVTNAIADATAFHGTATGAGVGLYGTSATGPGVRARTNEHAALYATSGDATDAFTPEETAYTGAYAFSPADPDANFFAAGVWGDSPEVGVYGSGGNGLWGDGNVGVLGRGYGAGGAGVFGRAHEVGTVGVHAYSPSLDRTSLKVTGKTSFSRSGRTYISAGASAKVVYLAGISTSSWVLAVLATNRSGRWVRAVVPATGRFTIYLNTTVPGTTNVVWFVLN